MEDIEVSLNKSVLLSNIKKCLAQFGENGTSFMMKAQFLKDKEIRDLFFHYKTYTTSNICGFLRYDKDCLVADLLEEREGYPKEYFEKRQGNNDWASEKDSEIIILANGKGTQDEMLDVISKVKGKFEIKSASVAFSKILELAKKSLGSEE